MTKRSVSKQRKATCPQCPVIHYKDLYVAANLLSSIPEKDLAIVKKKPPSTDRQADPMWRRVCARYGILTKAKGESSDSVRYARIKRLEDRVKLLEDQKSRCEEERRKCREALARLKLSAQRQGIDIE